MDVHICRCAALSNCIKSAAALTISVLFTNSLWAQFEVVQWANFEDGKFPQVSQLVGANAPKVFSIVDLTTVQGMPPEFRNAEAAAETGHYALFCRAQPTPGQKNSETAGVAIGEKLDRDKLGNAGRSLYQADVFLPAATEQTPDVAVLAMEPVPAEGVKTQGPRSFYRFGLAAGRVYFSMIEPTTNTATIYKVDKGLTDGMPRPGWHRLAIAFEGHDNIRCYIDGREASFSPITDGKLRSLSVGIMCAWKSTAYNAYIDNLSIQSTAEPIGVPVSPYSLGWKFPAGPPSVRKTGVAAAPAATIAGATWLEPEAAWAKAKSEKKPFLLYFTAEGVPAVDELNKMIKSDPKTESFFATRACTKVDMNQLRGGTIARDYAVFKAPTFLVISHDAQTNKRATFRIGQKWEDVAAQLSGVD